MSVVPSCTFKIKLSLLDDEIGNFTTEAECEVFCLEIIQQLPETFSSVRDPKYVVSNEMFELVVTASKTEEELMELAVREVVQPRLVSVIEQFAGGSIENTRVIRHPDPTKCMFLGRSVQIMCGRFVKNLSVDDLTHLWAVANSRLVLVTGTGMTMSLTSNSASTWTNFLNQVKDSVWPVGVAQIVFSLAKFEALKDDAHAQSEYLYKCAEREGVLPKVTSKILEVMSQLMPTEPAKTAWKDALLPFSGPILTFNYDILLEVAIGRIPTSSVPARDVPIQAKDNNNIVHIHGIFTHDESIVLRQRTYLEAAKKVPDYFSMLADEGSIFLYIGVNGVLRDPDLAPFWRYEAIQHAIGERRVPHTHFVLFKGTETPPFPLRDQLPAPNSTGATAGAINAVPAMVDPATGGPPSSLAFFKKIPYSSHTDISNIVGRIVRKEFNF